MVPRTLVEELEVKGSELVERVRALAREGNARHVTIVSQDGQQFVSVSLTLGAVAGSLVTLAAPAMAALGALAALATRVRMVITRNAPERAGEVPPGYGDTAA